MFILFVDYGLKRCGTALGDSSTKIIMPLKQVQTKLLLNQIENFAKEYQIEKIVWGVPNNINNNFNNLHNLERDIKNFARHVYKLTNIPYSFIDETLTTEIQKQFIKKKDKNHKKYNHDVISAMLIAEDYFNNTIDQ